MELADKSKQYESILHSTKQLIKLKSKYLRLFCTSPVYPKISGMYANLEMIYVDFLVEYFFGDTHSSNKKLDDLYNIITTESNEILDEISKQQNTKK